MSLNGVHEAAANGLQNGVLGKRRHGSRTIGEQDLRKENVDGAEPFDDEPIDRPRTRLECATGPRPCPYVACRHHLYVDVGASQRSLKMNFPELEPDELVETCSLDLADRGDQSLEQVSELMNMTRQGVSVIEMRALVKVERLLRRRGGPEQWMPVPLTRGGEE